MISLHESYVAKLGLKLATLDLQPDILPTAPGIPVYFTLNIWTVNDGDWSDQGFLTELDTLDTSLDNQMSFLILEYVNTFHAE